MITFMSQLNPQQRAVVSSPKGHLLINAGAGTGKTTTLAARILYLQKFECVPHYSMLGLSFSRAARANLIEKMSLLSKNSGYGGPIRVFTFHGLAYRILLEAAKRHETWLRPGFELNESGPETNKIWHRHSDSILGNLKDDFDKTLRPQIYAQALNVIRQNCTLDSTTSSNYSFLVRVEHADMWNVSIRNIDEVLRRFIAYQKRYNSIDYAGLIPAAVDVLAKKAETFELFRRNLEFIFVDEYQDTSRAQEKLLFTLASNDTYLNVVGDDNQTIYAFNGSDVSNIQEFASRAAITGLPVLSPITLDINYRSGKSILDTANHLISPLKTPLRKILKPTPTDSRLEEAQPSVRSILAPRLELAADFIVNEIKQLLASGWRKKDIVILVRKNTGYYPQADLVVNMLEGNGLSTTSLERPDIRRKEAVIAITEISQDNYLETTQALYDKIVSDEILITSGCSKQEIISLLLEIIQSGVEWAYDVPGIYADPGPEPETAEEIQHIRVKTIHSAKGAEYPIVFILYLGESHFPSGASPDCEEERRVLYVASTRAQKKLYFIGKRGAHPDFYAETILYGIPETQWLVKGGKESLMPQNARLENIILGVEKAVNAEEEERKRMAEELAKVFD